MKRITLGDIASLLNVPAPRDTSRSITGIATLAEATADEISLLGSDTYLPQFEKTKAAAVLVSRRVHLTAHVPKTVMLVEDADLAAAKVLELFAPPIPRPPVGIDQSATIAPTAAIGENARIGPHVVIGDNARIGKNTALHGAVYI